MADDLKPDGLADDSPAAWFQRHLDGEALDQTQIPAMEAWLREPAQARQAARWMEEARVMRDWARSQAVAGVRAPEPAALHPGTPSLGSPSCTRLESNPRSRPAPTRRFPLALTAAAVLALVVAVVLLRQPGYHLEADGTAIARGQVLHAGSTPLPVDLGGYVHATLAAGSTARIDGDERDERLALIAGSVSCAVDRHIGRFSVVTTLGEVAVTGTAFTTTLEGNPVPNRLLVAVTAGAVLVSGSWGSATVAAGESQAFPPVPISASSTVGSATKMPATDIAQVHLGIEGRGFEFIDDPPTGFPVPNRQTYALHWTTVFSDSAGKTQPDVWTGFKLALTPTIFTDGTAELVYRIESRASVTAAPVVAEGTNEFPATAEANVWTGFITHADGRIFDLRMQGQKRLKPRPRPEPDPTIRTLRLTIEGWATANGRPVVIDTTNGVSGQKTIDLEKAGSKAVVTATATVYRVGIAEMVLVVEESSSNTDGSTDTNRSESHHALSPDPTHPGHWSRTAERMKAPNIPDRPLTITIDANPTDEPGAP